MVGPTPTFKFSEIWLVDFEFRFDGGLHIPLCMVARGYYSGREYRLWRKELLKLSTAPFSTGDESCFVAYMAAAELNCFLALGWRLPNNVLGLAQEHKRRISTGQCRKSAVGRGLRDALRYRKLIRAIEMRNRRPHILW
jgi:DNA polymerase-1